MAKKDDSDLVEMIVAKRMGKGDKKPEPEAKGDEKTASRKPGKLGLALAGALGLDTKNLDGEAIESLVADICEDTDYE